MIRALLLALLLRLALPHIAQPAVAVLWVAGFCALFVLVVILLARPRRTA